MLAASLLCALHLAAAPADARPGNVFSLPDDAFAAVARADLDDLKRHLEGLDRVAAQLAPHRALFKRGEKTPYTPEEKRTLLSTWAAIHDYVFSAELIRHRYSHYALVPRKDALRHAWGFVLAHGALAAELAHGLAFADLAAGNKQLEVLLDEPSPEFGIPPRAFADFKLRVIHVSTATQLVTGEAWGHQLLPVLRAANLLDIEDARWLIQRTRRNAKDARSRLGHRGIALFAKNGADIVQDGAAAGVFPIQKEIAEWMGDTRVHRAGRPLITREQVEALLPEMQPGDVVVARQNWFLSNVGLPGFWPHAELYLGTREELAAYFDSDPEVTAWVATLPGAPSRFSEYLAASYPEKWKAFGGKDDHGEPIRIMESISEGVSFTGVDHGLRVDYVGVMRPRLSRVEKARAVARAFAYQGRPYDFNFDFFSDSTLVCTELVYKSYAPGAETKGLRIDLVDVAGRRTLPANEFVRLFDEELNRPDRQLDFVAFLDGSEKTGAAVRRDAEAFRATWRRIKWDIAQR